MKIETWYKIGVISNFTLMMTLIVSYLSIDLPLSDLLLRLLKHLPASLIFGVIAYYMQIYLMKGVEKDRTIK